MVSLVRSGSVALSFAVTLLAFGAPAAHGSGPHEASVDASTLAGMESRAAGADPREQCFLYTELLHDWTELAGRSMTDGDDAAVLDAMHHADADAAHLKVAIGRDSRRLKNAEMLMEHSVRRLSDMLHASSLEQRDALQTVVRHVSDVHDELLAAVFAH